MSLPFWKKGSHALSCFRSERQPFDMRKTYFPAVYGCIITLRGYIEVWNCNDVLRPTTIQNSLKMRALKIYERVNIYPRIAVYRRAQLIWNQFEGHKVGYLKRAGIFICPSYLCLCQSASVLPWCSMLRCYKRRYSFCVIYAMSSAELSLDDMMA